MITLAVRTLPRQSRHQDGESIESLAAEMVDGGSHASVQAAGIASYGVKKRILLNRRWVTALPWRDALWLLALPIASVQAALLLLSTNAVQGYADAQVMPATWTFAAISACLVAIGGAVSRRRSALLFGSILLLALLIVDEYAAGGGMRGGTSATADFSFSPLIRDSILGPIALVIIPTTLLLVVTGFVRPGEATGRRELRWARASAWCAFPILAAVTDLSNSRLAIATVGVGIVTLAISSIWQKRPERALAAGLLLGSQSILLGLQLWIQSAQSMPQFFYEVNPWVAAFGSLAIVIMIPALVALVIVRLGAGPRRLP